MSPKTYSTLVRAAYLDREGAEHQLLIQSTEDPERFVEGPFKAVLEHAFSTLGAELLALQVIAERAERLELPLLRGRGTIRDGNVLEFRRSGTATDPS